MSTELMLQDEESDLNLYHLSATICAELAAGLTDVEGVKARYGLTDAQWDRLRKAPAFRAMLKEAIERLSGDLNAGKRITMKAEVALEDSIEVLYKMAHSRDTPSAQVVDSIKTLAMLAGRTQKQAEGPGGGGFAVNINIATDKPAGVVISSPGPG